MLDSNLSTVKDMSLAIEESSFFHIPKFRRSKNILYCRHITNVTCYLLDKNSFTLLEVLNETPITCQPYFNKLADILQLYSPVYSL